MLQLIVGIRHMGTIKHFVFDLKDEAHLEQAKKYWRCSPSLVDMNVNNIRSTLLQARQRAPLALNS